MTEREGQLNDTAVLDEETPSPESSAAEPETPAMESAALEPATQEAVAPETPEPRLPPQPGDANLSPDATTLAFFQRDETGTVRLWLAPLDGTPPRAVETSLALPDTTEPPQWSPDGAAFAVSAINPETGRATIYVLTIETGEARLLVDHQSADRAPRWSPDGTMIAFIARRDDRDAVSVAFVDGIGPAVQLSHGHPGQDEHDPCWSFDGQRIAFARRTVENDQVGDQIWTVNVASGETKQITKRLANRRALIWSPDRALILHIADDGEWDNVAVVNADNSAGWNIASELGDKDDPHYSSDGQRVVYTRLKDGVIRCCERAASSSTAEVLDPGDGTVRSPRFLPDKRVVYLYQPATGFARFIAQEPKADAERTELPAAVAWSAPRALVTPYHAEIEVNGRKIGGLLYRPVEISGPVPIAIVLTDRPETARAARFDLFAQSLVASGLAVYAVSLPGTGGYGRKVITALKEQTGSELEVGELMGVLGAVKTFEGIDYGRIAVIGAGYGGTLAMLLAGSRPGQVQSVVAIDPITDWDIEYDHADAALRAWLAKTYGVPALARGVYALRTPITFAGVIDAPLLLIATDRAPAGRAEQLDELLADLGELEASYEHEESRGESEWQLGQRVAAFLRRSLAAATSPIDARIEQAMEAAAI
jgi:dipeptidyl aminopeptidase/acylaminoacyl peptidase